MDGEGDTMDEWMDGWSERLVHKSHSRFDDCGYWTTYRVVAGHNVSSAKEDYLAKTFLS